MTQRPARGQIAVIGAGWAGLVAARDLQLAGFSVHLFELGQTPGGRARTTELSLAGRLLELDNGQHLLIGAYTRTLARLRQLGLDPARVLRRLPLQFESSTFGLRRQGPGQAGLAAGLLLARGMTAGDRWSLIRLGMTLAKRQWQGFSGQTLDRLLHDTNQSPSIINRFWRPFCLAALNTPVESACAQTFVNVLHDSLAGGASGSDFLVPTVPLGQVLAIPLLAAIEAGGGRVSLGTPVRGLSRVTEGWDLAGSARQPGIALGTFDQVVIATASAHAGALLKDVAPGVSDRLLAFAYQAIQTTYLAWPADTPLNLPAIRMLDERPADGWHGQWFFDRGRQAGLRVAAVVTSARDTVMLTNQALGAGVASQVSSALGLPAPHDIATVNERRATFSCAPDRPRGAPQQIDGQPLPGGLFLAADYCTPRWPATLEGAIRAGEAAAQAVAQSAGAALM